MFRGTELANLLGVGFALIHKDRIDEGADDGREGEEGGKDDGLVLVGNVKDKIAIMIDDRADTCITLAHGASVLKRYGAKRIYAAVTHGIFSGDSLSKIQNSHICEIITSNTIPQQEHDKESTKVRVFDISPILAEAIRRTHNGESISYLFNPTAFQ